MKFLGTAKGRI